jgi:hypothetical protein
VSERNSLPEALRHALEVDHRVVHPLRPAPVRALWVAVWAALTLAVLPAVIGIRGDAASLGWALSWGAVLAECGVGFALVVLSLREGVPGSGVTLPVGLTAVAAGIGVHVLVAVLSWLRRGMPTSTLPPPGASCFPKESMLALPALALTLLLVVRAFAVRPRWAGVLGGAGAGLLADGVWHMICPYSQLAHVLVWHGGAVLTLIALGWVAGLAIEKARGRRLSS